MPQQAGLPRTGSVSFQAAMHRLGYSPCFHGLTDIARGGRFQPAFYRKMYTAPTPERYSMLHQLYDRYAAATDVPTFLFIEDLVQIYPDAKVVLGLRSSAAAWCKSHGDTVDVFLNGDTWLSRFAMLTHQVRPGVRFFGQFYAEWRRRVGGPITTPEVYEAFARKVREVVPEDKLLEFQPGDGYAPLCRFLDRPVPDEQYPRLNDTRHIVKMAYVGILFGSVIWVLIFLAGLLLAYGVWLLQARYL